MVILTCSSERQLAEAQGGAPLSREPTQSSHLLHSTTTTDDEAASPSPVAATSGTPQPATVSETVKAE